MAIEMLPLFSAASHVVEPSDLWLSRLGRPWRDKAPRIEERGDCDWFVIPNSGVQEKPVGHRYLDVRPGAYDPAARLADQDLEGVIAEVIYPGWMILHEISEFDFKAACFRAYNDWLLDDFCACAPDRLLGAALLPVGNGPIEVAVAEARRAAGKGAREVLLPQAVPGLPYNAEHYDPLWEILEELGVPVAFHHASARSGGNRDVRAGSDVEAITNKTSMGQIATQLVWGGVATAHPGLRFVLVEGGFGWVAYLLDQWDQTYMAHRRSTIPNMTMQPSEYFFRQFHATFVDDRPGFLTLQLLDPRCLFWGTGYPDREGVFPESGETVLDTFRDVAPELRRMLTLDNAARLYAVKVRLPAV
jgi:predicted TIM-barrel fold metal-dependent hydrolase